MSEWSNLKFEIVNLQLELDAANNGREFAAMRANRLQKEIENLEQRLDQARREADESAKDAFRRGWEQAKREAHHLAFAYGCSKAIAAMKYGENE